MLDFEFITIDGRKNTPLTSQLYEEIRDAVLSGRLAKETRLPSSRKLAEKAGVSRTTVLSALDQLIAEGFLTTKAGSGTFVCGEFPADRIFFHRQNLEQTIPESIDRTADDGVLRTAWSTLAETIEPFSYLYTADVQAFRPGVPALDTFPFDVWAKTWRRVWQNVKMEDLSYRHPLGCEVLRNRIAEYLSANRGVRCSADQIILMGGTTQILDLISRLLIDNGDGVYVENPGFASARQIFSVNGAKLKPLEVDGYGAVVPSGKQSSSKDKLVSLTPSHQFPLGVTMPVDRRLEWLDWAKKRNCLIVEDDYDSEFRYSQKPVPAMQGLDDSQHTIYIGSFSKVVFPSLSMAYVVVPPRLCAKFQKACSVLCRPPSAIDQMALAEFIQKGDFLRHVRRLRRTHKLRREVFVERISALLSDKLELLGTEAGLHCVGRFVNSINETDVEICGRLAKHKVYSMPLSKTFLESTPRSEVMNGLLLGFAGSRPGAIRYSANRLAQLL